MKDNCNKNCSNCNGTELPNISDTKEINIGYSYAYKTDCEGDRYIKAEEVKYLLKCERNNAIDEFAKGLTTYLGVENATKYGNKNAEQQRISYDTLMKYEIADAIDDIAEQLKERD